MAFNTDSDSFRRKYLGPSSLQVYSQWLELSFQSLGASISRRFKFGMRICEEMDLPLSATLPILPTEWRRYVNVFFDNMHPLFPLLDREAFTSRAEHISESGSMQATPAASRPYLACLYAVVSIGMDEASQSDSQPDYQYLQAAYSLYAHLVALPYFESAQALLLLTIALRGRNKDGAAWQTLGQAIRILQSLGLHRRRPPGQNGHDLAAELDKRVWWSAYCLEKLLVFEAGRPSMIHDGDVDQELPTPTMHPDVLSAMIGLCRIQESIISRLYNKRMWTTVQKPRNVLLATGELDALLIQWAESLPRTLRPDYDMGSCPPELHTFRSFLTMQFQQTMVTLHRSALLMDSSIHRANIDSFCSHTPFAHRLRSSETVCVRAARSIISVFLDSTHGSCTTRLNTLTQPLLAIYVLGIFIMKHPTAWTARSDLTLLQAGAEVVEQCYRDYGFDPEFCAMMSNLVRIAARYVDHSPSGAGGRVRKATTGTPQ
ncbi:hypothetical protein H2203_003327 [Taxawa tesnikishii (nom. ined.)]|nr:hypothetical protein H2203_003327 [Dothideales sp. JES 119]